MNTFLFKLFQIFGVFPFTKKNHKIVFSNFMYGWSVFITSLFIAISIKRSLYYYEDNATTYSYVFAMLSSWEPYFPLIEICLSSIPIYTSLKRVKKYIQNLIILDRSVTCTNKIMMIKVMLIMGEICIMVISLKLYYFPTVELLSDTIDGSCTVLQSFCYFVHILHCFVALNRMVENLKIVEKNLKRGELNTVFKDYCKVLETYEGLGKSYQFYMSFLLLLVFYDTMSGVKKLQDYIFNNYGAATQGDFVEAVIVFWWLCYFPPLTLVLHEGHLFHEKVKSVRIVHANSAVHVTGYFC